MKIFLILTLAALASAVTLPLDTRAPDAEAEAEAGTVALESRTLEAATEAAALEERATVCKTPYVCLTCSFPKMLYSSQRRPNPLSFPVPALSPLLPKGSTFLPNINPRTSSPYPTHLATPNTP